MTDWYAVGAIILGVVGIGATIVIALTVYSKQKKDGVKLQEAVDSIKLLTEQKTKDDRETREFECKRIIGHLQKIQELEISLRDCLNNYQVGDPTNELSNFFMTITVHRFDYKIAQMNDAMGQLQGKLKDNSLRLDFMDYLGAFNVLPERILIDKMPQQGQNRQRDYLLDFIAKQMGKIQEFIDRFTQETEEA